MDFICFAIQSSCNDYPYQYLLYFIMFSKLISDLSAPIIEDIEIEKLQNRAIEMVCIHEGMFPVSETHMVFHQLIDLPGFLRKFGPIRGWWTLPSERGISIIKQNLGKGNYNKFYRRIYQKEYVKEYLKSKDRYSLRCKLFAKDNTIDEDEQQLSFSDFRTELGERRRGGHSCNLFQIRNLVEFMLNELNEMTSESKELHSPLLRLHFYFKKFSSLYNNKSKNFLSFLEYLSCSRKLFDPHNFVEDDHPCNGSVDEESWSNLKKIYMVKNESYFIFRKDFNFIEVLFSEHYRISYYTKAYIWGVLFKGMGNEYYEEKDPTDDYSYGMDTTSLEYFPSNEKNDWRRNDIKLTSKAVSSLCLVRINQDEDIYFCQINNFSKLNDPMEPLLQGITFAIVVTRNCTNVKLHGENLKYKNLYKSNLTFLPTLSIVKLIHIYPCPLAVVHMDESMTPLKPNEETKTANLIFFLLYRNRELLIDNKTINQISLSET